MGRKSTQISEVPTYLDQVVKRIINKGHMKLYFASCIEGDPKPTCRMVIVGLSSFNKSKDVGLLHICDAVAHH